MAKKSEAASIESVYALYSAEKEEEFISTNVMALDDLWGWGCVFRHNVWCLGSSRIW